MKKIMIALGAVVCAFAANASMVNWEYCGTINNDGVTGINGKAWVLCLGSGTDTSSIKIDDKGNLVMGEGIKVQDASGTVGDGYASFDGSAITVAGKQNYVILFSDTENKLYGFSEVIDVTPNDTSTAIVQESAGKFGDYDSYEATLTISTPWQAVPEPTSGLLLLIGVAGLALRRRRA